MSFEVKFPSFFVLVLRWGKHWFWWTKWNIQTDIGIFGYSVFGGRECHSIFGWRFGFVSFQAFHHDVQTVDKTSKCPLVIPVLFLSLSPFCTVRLVGQFTVELWNHFKNRSYLTRFYLLVDGYTESVLESHSGLLVICTSSQWASQSERTFLVRILTAQYKCHHHRNGGWTLVNSVWTTSTSI